MDAGTERTSGHDFTKPDIPPKAQTSAIFIPQTGFDLLTNVESVRVGAGLFLGTPISRETGVQAGLRLVVGAP
jgi:hypothetical protein